MSFSFVFLLFFVCAKTTQYQGILVKDGYKKISNNNGNNDNNKILNDKQKHVSNVDELRMLNHENRHKGTNNNNDDSDTLLDQSSKNSNQNGKIYGKPKPIDGNDISTNSIINNVDSEMNKDNKYDNNNQELGLFGRLFKFFSKRTSKSTNNDDKHVHEAAIIMVDEDDNHKNDDDFVDKFLDMLDGNHESNAHMDSKLKQETIKHDTKTMDTTHNMETPQPTMNPTESPVVLTKENILDEFLKEHTIDKHVTNTSFTFSAVEDKDKHKTNDINSSPNKDENQVDSDGNNEDTNNLDNANNDGYRHYVQLSYFLLH